MPLRKLYVKVKGRYVPVLSVKAEHLRRQGMVIKDA